MLSLLRKLFWVVLFLISTFCFVVLFQRGPTNFTANAQEEFEHLKKLFGTKIERPDDQSDAATR